MKKLSRPQIDALRYARRRQLYAADINDGNGNMRRTLLSLLKFDMLAWDPIYHGRVVLTPAGEQQLQQAQEKERARVRGTIDDPQSALRIARRERELTTRTPPDPPGTLRIKDVGDRRVITLTSVHGDKEQS